MRTVAFLAVALVAATTTSAHQGVQNPVVMQRMHAMMVISDNMKVVGEMAKGKAEFDAGAARAALEEISNQAIQTPVLFASKEDDPKSEARDEIWNQFEDFTSKARELEVAAANLATTVEQPGDLGPALQRLGETCKSCHAIYRE